jgi:mRNA-degrading endonuclease toxin of MazEF toxin-antitoxin module
VWDDKRRPALVISPDSRNTFGSDVLVIPCSTTQRLGPWHVRLRKGEGGLRQDSVAKCEGITTLPRELVDERPLGEPLSPARLREIERATIRAIGALVDER